MNFIPCRPSFCSLPLLLLLSPATQERLTSAQQPHILLIVADDLGYNDVSWHNPALVTPHLETLARWVLATCPLLTSWPGPGSSWSRATSSPSAPPPGPP